MSVEVRSLVNRLLTAIPRHERRERKRAAEMLLARVARLDPGDTALLAEAKAIEDRRRAEEKARRPPPREPRRP